MKKDDNEIQKGMTVDLVNEKSLIMGYDLNGMYIVNQIDGDNVHIYKKGESKAVNYIISKETFNKFRV